MYIEQLEARLQANWTGISTAKTRTDDLLSQLRTLLSDLEDPVAAVVVTGSLGRGEVTEGSDADWMLLVDGPSNVDHAALVSEVARRLNEVLKPPGDTGTFGELVSSHDLVQYIAGTRDSNENLTRRMLLLAESRALTGTVVRERVLRNVLTRYVVTDRSVPRRDGTPYPIPHFLLNDIVRYWRTMASDYASKMWEKRGKGWAIRNVKLRFSRKLLFVRGLITAFSAELFPDERLRELQSNPEEYYFELAESLGRLGEITPLELLARAVLQQPNDETAKRIFSSYNEFLLTLSDPERRKILSETHIDQATTEETYGRLRELSGNFREGINNLFFDDHVTLRRLIRRYGVF